MPLKVKAGNGPQVRRPETPYSNVRFIHDRVSQLVSGGTFGQVSDKDTIVNRYVGAVSYDGGSVRVEGFGEKPYTIDNLNPEIATISADGTINRLVPGIVKLVLNGPVTKELTLYLTNKVNYTQPDVYVSVAPASLAAHCINQVQSRINSGMTMDTHGRIYTTQDHANSVYTRNPNVWCAGVNFTGVSPFCSRWGGDNSATLISPRHILSARHFPIIGGETIRFVEANGTVHSRTLLAHVLHPQEGPLLPDLSVGVLDSELPASISPVKMMPTNWRNYMANNYLNRVTAVGFNKEELATIRDFAGGPGGSAGSFRIPLDPVRSIFYKTLIPGDSSNPAFLLVNGEPVLVTVWTTDAGGGAGTAVGDRIPQINQMILSADAAAGVGTIGTPSWPNASNHYLVKTADFSAFPTYL